MNRRNFTLSTVTIARNEEARITSCLSTLAWAHDRLVVDNGSTDRTKERAQHAGARVIAADEADFSALRNLGISETRGDFILYIDADETATPELRDEILRLLGSFRPERDAHVFRLSRKNVFLNHPWPKDEYLERLFWRPAIVNWYGPIHESPMTRGSVQALESSLLHDTHRTLSEMTDKTNDWSEREAQLRLTAQHPRIVPWRLFRVMMTGFLRSFVRDRGIMVGSVGLIEGIFQAFSMFVTYAKLYEMQNDTCAKNAAIRV